MVAIGHAQTRLEIAAGFTKHKLAPEGAWHYDGFETDTRLLVGSYAVGLLWTPIKAGDWLIGARGGYANLGKVHAMNSFPIFERGPGDARINPVCDRATLYGCTGRFNGTGTTKGWYLGPAIERNFGSVAVGAEAGAYIYHSNWIARDLRVVDGGQEFIPPMWEGFVWDSAKGQHITPYVGANARWNNFFVSGRYYSQVHAARTELHPDFIGMTSGPVWSVMAGLSWEFM